MNETAAGAGSGRAAVRIPPQLAAAVVADDAADPAAERRAWLAALPAQITDIAAEWELQVGDPYLPGGQCAWVAPARTATGKAVVLKVAWRHPESEHEPDGLLHWDGDGAVRCYAKGEYGRSTALLLERCSPGVQLKVSVSEPEQDEIIAGLLRRLWARTPQAGHRFRSLDSISSQWADAFELAYDTDNGGLDPGLAGAGVELLRTLPASAPTQVLLCTDLHAENVLSAGREPWLMIDPKPFLGDPAFDPVQQMLNCEARLAADPFGLTRRMAGLLELDPGRLRLWLFARCAQESLRDPPTRELARRLAP